MEQGDETHIPLGEWGTSTKSYNIIHALREVWRKDPRSTEDSEPNYMWGKEFCKIQNCQEETTVWVHLNKNHGWLPLNLISQRALCVFLQTFPLGCILQHIYPSFEFDCYNALLREIFFFFFFFAWNITVVKNPPAKAGDSGDVGSIPELGRANALEEQMTTHSSVLT